MGHRDIEPLVGSWSEKLYKGLTSDYVKKVAQVISEERKTMEIYPAPDRVFAAFRECPIDKFKVVILGQDPYYTPGMADGLAFSVPDNSPKIPPSLQNIFKEVEADMEENDVTSLHPFDFQMSPNLTRWANQGVLLLNSALTVRRSQPESHSPLWQPVTEALVKMLSTEFRPVVWILWGNHAKSIATPHLNSRDSLKLVLTSSHPSPLSANRGFLGSRPFSKTNNWLKELGLSPINWPGTNP